MSGYDKIPHRGLVDFQPQPAMHGSMFYGNFPDVDHEYHPLLHPGGGPHVVEPEFKYPSGEFLNNQGMDVGKPAGLSLDQLNHAQARNFSVPHTRATSTSSVVMNHRKRKASSVDGFDTAPSEIKRKSSSVDEFDMLPIHKKRVVAQVHVQDPNGDYYDLSGHTSPYSQFVPTPTGSTGFPSYPGYSSSPRPSGHQYSTSNASQISLAAPSPHTPSFSPSFTTVKSEQSPGAPMTPLPHAVSASSPVKSSVPKLIRTSTIQQSPPGVVNNVAVGQTQNFNPYAMYPLKANLKLKGDLETMKLNWTPEEREARRRLVEFKRSQNSCTINAEFGPVAPQDRISGSICISCIWWKEKNEFYVTSVDTIYLLEALVGVRFTVEEKNRIRRNLEGFRPMTVSKSKADSEEFFKVIMGFPHPKPRNIEKDVKIFPWKILSTALKKIISKYSASYSSTAAAILTPQAAHGPHSEGHADYYDMSPRTGYVPSHGGQYFSTNDVAYMQGPPSASFVPTSAPALQLQMPEYTPAYSVNGQFPCQTLTQMPPNTMSIPAQPMTAPATRMPSWDFGNYVDDYPMPMPHSAPPTAYPNGMMQPAEFYPGMHYPAN
ncbi:hypothetical protein B0A52_00468 [Exophiala mesophila]|uniref:DUF7082 domain-containing protein n=1 Tax=Exophiala mesophila TaxID=212818 RepID=A0A438NK42_EXOME|nr:hypothetical protein B0A52_00468 [Exophiala mesophila]